MIQRYGLGGRDPADGGTRVPSAGRAAPTRIRSSTLAGLTRVQSIAIFFGDPISSTPFVLVIAQAVLGRLSRWLIDAPRLRLPWSLLALRFRRKKPVSSSYPPEIRPLHHFHFTAHRPLVGRSAERSGRRRSPRGRSYRFEQLMWPTRPLLWASQPPAAWHPTTVAGSYFAAARAERAQSAQQSDGFGAMRTSHHGFQSARAGAPYPRQREPPFRPPRPCMQHAPCAP